MSSMKVAMMHFVQHKYIVHIGLEIKKTHKIPKTNQFHGKKRKYIFMKKDFVNFGSALFLKLLSPIVSYSFWSLGISRITNLSFEKKKMKMVYG